MHDIYILNKNFISQCHNNNIMAIYIVLGGFKHTTKHNERDIDKTLVFSGLIIRLCPQTIFCAMKNVGNMYRDNTKSMPFVNEFQ